MDRGERRVRTERAKRRRLVIVYGRAEGPSYAAFEVPFMNGQGTWSTKPWRMCCCIKLMTMKEYGPKSWTHPKMIRPARGKQNHMLRAQKFEDFFPDYKKPKVYCW
jgi:hypothetical protein